MSTDLILEPFRDRLVRPDVLRPTLRDGVDSYRIEVRAGRVRLHADLPATPVWTYNGTFPGPTIEARRDRAVEIEWSNALGGADHPARTFIGNPAPGETSQSRPGCEAVGHWLSSEGLTRCIVTHLHGAVVQPQSDGWPDNAFLPGMSVKCFYPNCQRGALLWYHDHAMGQTAQNVYAGLAGLYIIRDEEEAGLGLPTGDRELVLVLQDRNLDLDAAGHPTGALLYKLDQPMGEFYGPYTLVNGTIWPFAEVGPHQYRLRMLNGSNARFYRLALVDADAHPCAEGTLTLIGADGGLLARPTAVRDPILLAPGERIDLVADFAAYAGQRLGLRNDAPAPFPSGAVPANDVVIQFRIAADQPGDRLTLPPVLSRVERLAVEPGTIVRVITLDEDPAQPGMMRLNGKGFHDGVDEMPLLGATEIWEFRNPTNDTHPMHLHLVTFQVLSRTDLDPSHPSAQPLGIADHERAWKDIVSCHPGQATRVVARFEPFPGQYMYHCHILEHEDHDMMRAYVVVPPAGSG